MYLKVNDEEVAFKVTQRSTFVSKHSGKTLEKITAEITVREKQSHDFLLEMWNKASEEGISSTDGQGNVEKTWIIAQGNLKPSFTYSYQESNKVKTDEWYLHTFELEEYEELLLTKLTLDALTLKPYSYNEGLFDDKLVAFAKIAAAKTQEAKLRKLLTKSEDISVKRYGISEEPKKMKIFDYQWSQGDDRNKYYLALWEGVSGDLPRKGFGSMTKLSAPIVSEIIKNVVEDRQIMILANLRHIAAQNKETIDRLIEILNRKSVLVPNDVESLYTTVQKNIPETKFDFSRVPDIDDFH
jgi:hypothetical protein